MITLITGGARSGKSRYALELALEYEKRGFIATAQAMDAEMEERIARHKSERGKKFTTIEEPLDLAGALEQISGKNDVVLIDCLTVWAGNLIHKHGQDKESFDELSDLLETLKSTSFNIIIVTNEVGMGIVPDNALARKYRDIAGRINQDVAKLADKVILIISGMPLNIKSSS